MFLGGDDDIGPVENIWPALGVGFDRLQLRASIFLDPASKFRQGPNPVGAFQGLANTVIKYAKLWKKEWEFLSQPVPGIVLDEGKIAVAGAHAEMFVAMQKLERNQLSEEGAAEYIRLITDQTYSIPTERRNWYESLIGELKWVGIAAVALVLFGLYGRARG